MLRMLPILLLLGCELSGTKTATGMLIVNGKGAMGETCIDDNELAKWADLAAISIASHMDIFGYSYSKVMQVFPGIMICKIKTPGTCGAYVAVGCSYIEYVWISDTDHSFNKIPSPRLIAHELIHTVLSYFGLSEGHDSNQKKLEDLVNKDIDSWTS